MGSINEFIQLIEQHPQAIKALMRLFGINPPDYDSPSYMVEQTQKDALGIIQGNQALNQAQPSPVNQALIQAQAQEAQRKQFQSMFGNADTNLYDPMHKPYLTNWMQNQRNEYQDMLKKANEQWDQRQSQHSQPGLQQSSAKPAWLTEDPTKPTYYNERVLQNMMMQNGMGGEPSSFHPNNEGAF